MVLRHQVPILERQLNARVAYRPVDRAILAALFSDAFCLAKVAYLVAPRLGYTSAGIEWS